MSKKHQFNIYRDALNIPNVESIPTAYQLLGLPDFESNPHKIADAFAKRSEEIAQLQARVSNLTQELEEAKALISNDETKQGYDEQLVRVGYAGLPRLGLLGGAAIFFSFVLSIAIVYTMTFYVYPIIVPIDPEPVGDSVTTLAEYSSTKDERSWNDVKAKQSDITTMDVSINVPIEVDSECDGALTESETMPETVTEPSASVPTQPGATAPTESGQPAGQQSVSDTPVEQQPAAEQQTVPDKPVDQQPAAEESTANVPSDSVVSEKPASLPESVPASENAESAQPAEPGLLEVPASQPESKVPAEGPPTDSTDKNSAVPSDATQTLESPKQLPTSIVNTIAESAESVRTKEQYEQLFKDAQQKENDLMKDKEFVYAEQIANIVYKACLRPEGKEFRVEALRQKERLSQLTKQWIAVSTAQVQFAKLEDKTQPNADADVIATWMIDVENDWDSALQYLLVSTNEQIRNAAQKEKNVDENKIESCIVVADAWWNVSQTPSALQKQFQNRACYWYSKVSSSVTDKNTKTLIEKRLSMAK